MTLANAARSNNMSPGQLRQWGAQSADEMLALFLPPCASGRNLTSELLGAINVAIDSIDTGTDTYKKTATYVKLLRDARWALSMGRLPWSDWIKLSKTAPSKKSEAFAEPVQIVAGEFEKNQALHDDIRAFCIEVFDLAADSLEAFQDLKAEQGMLDFVDQERLLYELLDVPQVRETLAEELQVLFVDEFQDTSPIQLALFMKLAELADRVIWVGDIKQAIYGFRGSDPKLMLATLAGVIKGGGTSDVLEKSWRSRPALVDYANAVFVPTFEGSLERRQVVLRPEHDEKTGAAAVACWKLGSTNWKNRGRDIAFGLQSLVDSGYEIVDKESRELRQAGYGDIAILCRTNDRLKSISAALAAAGIPVAFRRPELLKTPEGALSLACLRRLADPRDTLASAEIRTLVRSESPEAWLAERLEYLADGGRSRDWGETGADAIPELKALGEARDELSVLTPTEALELALVRGGVREAAIAWGPTADHTRHRLRNVDLLLEYAAQYEDQCDMLNVAATVSGLILWFDELGQRGEDWQAEAGDGRAVTLLTHHRAKGLEWPVVIAVDLDAPVRSSVWDLTVLQREDGFDIHAPLEGRRLRYWPWPFGGQQKGIPVADRVAAGPIGQAANANAIEEVRRLLYVSITRARDLLVIPVPSKVADDSWLSTLGVEWVLPEGDSLTLPDGKVIPTECLDVTAPEGWAVEARAYEARWVQVGEPRVDLLDRNLSPSKAAPGEDCVVEEVIEIGERLSLDGVSDVTALGNAIHSIIAAEVVSPEGDSAQRAARILDEWGFSDSVRADDAQAAARRFIGWVTETFEPDTWHVEYPMTHVLDSGQVVQGSIDLLLETADGWVIIDHKATPRPRAEWKDIARSYSGQLAMYRDAVEAVSGKPVIGTWIHFAVGGAVTSLCR
jgi:ATP-dependent exoDNAse (exonuclease V) beta subunit